MKRVKKRNDSKEQQTLCSRRDRSCGQCHYQLSSYKGLYQCKPNNDSISTIPPNKVDGKLNQLIQDIFIEYREVYGARRIKAVLFQQYGVIVSRRKIGKIMHTLNLRVKMKRKRKFRVTTTDSNHNYSISPNRLQRDFKTNVADEVYVGDITYIRTQQGWL